MSDELRLSPRVFPLQSCRPGTTDYDAIFAAVTEIDRGRRFLAEHARRNRQADTAEVVAAIDRMVAPGVAPLLGGVPGTLPQNRRNENPIPWKIYSPT